MHKLVILVETPQDEDAFNDEWPLFLFLAERMPGLRRESTSRVDTMLFGSLSFSLIHELFFDSLDDLKAAMQSQEGRLAGTQIQKMTRGRVALLIANHQEDSLEHIQQFSTGAAPTRPASAPASPPAEAPEEPSLPNEMPVQEEPVEATASIPPSPDEILVQEKPDEEVASTPAVEAPEEPLPPGDLPAQEEPDDEASQPG